MWKMCSSQAVCGKWVCVHSRQFVYGRCDHSWQFVVSWYVVDVIMAVCGVLVYVSLYDRCDHSRKFVAGWYVVDVFLAGSLWQLGMWCLC